MNYAIILHFVKYETIPIFVARNDDFPAKRDFVNSANGEMAEWLNAAVLKTVKDASPSGVRIPVSPLSM